MNRKPPIARRIVTAVDLAHDALCDTIAAHFPEATSGDLSPETTFAFSQTVESAVTEWVWANVSGCADFNVIKKLVDAERLRR